MRGINFVLLLILFVSNSNSFLSQYKNRCSAVAHKNSRRSLNPLLKISDSIGENQLQFKMNENSSLKRGKLFIPVVVHVIWNTPDQNISDEQIQSQIDVLNHDYGRRNSDLLPENHPFYKYGGGLDIHFFLAERDPSNRVSSGIVRVKTTITEWQDNDEMKSTNTGGSDYWDSRKYLNIYVVKFNNDLGLLGFAWPPSDLSTYPETDGVVIDFRAFGTKGTAGSEDFNAYALGRTTTHEVGHWLNLNHIWGDQSCGDDFISDTPIAEEQNNEMPIFPWRPNNKCGTDQNGEMFMNYMDYVYDNSMNMFTKQQVKRMYNSVMQYRSELMQVSYCSDLNIVGDSLFCEGSNFQFKVNRQRGDWIVSDTSKIRIDQNGYANLLKSGFVTISYVLDSTSACPGLTVSKNIQIEGRVISQISQNKDTLMVLPSDGSVQWMNCFNDSLLQGKLFDNKFSPLKSGLYSAVVTSDVCKDTTDCFSFVLSECLDLNIDGDSLFCEGSNFQFKVNRQRGNWIASDTSKVRIDQNGYANLLKSGFVTISYVLDSTSACPGLTASKNIQIEGRVISQISQNKDTLMVLPSDGSVQWMNCFNDSLLQGKLFENKFSPLKSGLYSAVVTSDVCKDTTDCFSIQLSDSTENFAGDFSVFPNPASNILYFNAPENIDFKVTIIALTGEILDELVVYSTHTSFPLNLENGLYLLKIDISDGNRFIHRLVVKK
jgi:hypothetical protein